MKEPAFRPLVLVACGDEWMGRSFESVFEQHGYAVARVESGARALKLARRASPDVIVLEEGLGELNARDVCRALGDDPLFDHSVPIVITSSGHVTPASRHAAYAAGAWEYCSQPVDLELLVLKLATFLRARQSLGAQRSERLMDPGSGLYTAFGLNRLAEQLGARALRKHEPFACVALSPVANDREVPRPAIVRDDQGDFAAVAELCRTQSRKSDVVGQVGASRLAIIAPDTDAAGARLLVGRLQRALDRAANGARITGEYRLRAGYCAVSDFSAAQMEPTELVRRASSALDHLQFVGEDDVLLGFDEVPATPSVPGLLA